MQKTTYKKKMYNLFTPHPSCCSLSFLPSACCSVIASSLRSLLSSSRRCVSVARKVPPLFPSGRSRYYSCCYHSCSYFSYTHSTSHLHLFSQIINHKSICIETVYTLWERELNKEGGKKTRIRRTVCHIRKSQHMMVCEF